MKNWAKLEGSAQAGEKGDGQFGGEQAKTRSSRPKAAAPGGPDLPSVSLKRAIQTSIVAIF